MRANEGRARPEFDHGVHAFIVQLRDANGKLLPGVHIRDNGPKMG